MNNKQFLLFGFCLAINHNARSWTCTKLFSPMAVSKPPLVAWASAICFAQATVFCAQALLSVSPRNSCATSSFRCCLLEDRRRSFLFTQVRHGDPSARVYKQNAHLFPVGTSRIGPKFNMQTRCDWNVRGTRTKLRSWQFKMTKNEFRCLLFTWNTNSFAINDVFTAL